MSDLELTTKLFETNFLFFIFFPISQKQLEKPLKCLRGEKPSQQVKLIWAKRDGKRENIIFSTSLVTSIAYAKMK
jgi:hypothetical protein